MLLGKKTIGLALAGLAAYAWHKYSKMSADEKRDLTNNLKEKGRTILDSIVPKKGTNSRPAFDEGTTFTG